MVIQKVLIMEIKRFAWQDKYHLDESLVFDFTILFLRDSEGQPEIHSIEDICIKLGNKYFPLDSFKNSEGVLLSEVLADHPYIQQLVLDATEREKRDSQESRFCVMGCSRK